MIIKLGYATIIVSHSKISIRPVEGLISKAVIQKGPARWKDYSFILLRQKAPAELPWETCRLPGGIK
ncbi:MAG: hypothetical protein ACFFD4_20990 [Candidatus Odinarchaeota archaeon]